MAADQAPAEPLPFVEPFGDRAVLITLATEATDATAARAQAVARRIRADRRWGAVVPAATSILVHLWIPSRELGVDPAAELGRLAALREPGDETWPEESPTVEIPVRYGGAGGPDLEALAATTGLTPAQLIEAHAGTTYRAQFLGFAPGFAYLGPLPIELVAPRRPSPRVHVPAGSVAIAGPYTAVYPIDSPGGWHLVGRTAVRVWDPARQPPALLEAGTIVRFVPETGR
ncbi:MAG TPA: 5-oxoprolinase subunit PxpB [Candidatus Limnocylindrales bacterium]